MGYKLTARNFLTFVQVAAITVLLSSPSTRFLPAIVHMP
jgi:hypothetical protein